MTKSPELIKLELSLNSLKKNAAMVEEDSNEGSDSTGGQGGVVVEKMMFIELGTLIRNGEKAFGVAHDFDVNAYLNKTTPQFQENLGHEGGLKSHPILSQLSKFDGDTPNMRMDPKENPQAQERYENRLQLRMALQNRQQHQSTPKLKPGGM